MHAKDEKSRAALAATENLDIPRDRSLLTRRTMEEIGRDSTAWYKEIDEQETSDGESGMAATQLKGRRQDMELFAKLEEQEFTQDGQDLLASMEGKDGW